MAARQLSSTDIYEPPRKNKETSPRPKEKPNHLDNSKLGSSNVQSVDIRSKTSVDLLGSIRPAKRNR